MKRWFVSHVSLVSALKVVDTMQLVKATNEVFAMWNDWRRRVLIVESENKPKNSPTKGIFWQEDLMSIVNKGRG